MIARTAPARPRLGPPPTWHFPEPHTATLSSGMTCWHYRLPGQHVATIQVGFPYTMLHEVAAEAGLTSLMSHCMDEGTTTHTSAEFALLSERLGAACAVGYTERGVIVSLDVATHRLAAALPLLRDLVTSPAFRDDDVLRIRDTSVADLHHRRSRADFRAGLEFAQLYYPDGSRYACGRGGTEHSLASLTPAHVRSHYPRLVSPHGAVVVTAGDLPPEHVHPLIENTFAEWAPERPELPTAAQTPQRDPASEHHVRLVHRPGSAQTEIFLGQPGPCREHVPTWAPYQVLSFLMGGWPGARLDAVLREDKGYTYSMSCGFQSRVDHGLFMVAAAVKTEAAGDALKLTLGLVDDARDGFTDAELAAGRDFLTLTAPSRYACADDVSGEAITRWLHGESTQQTSALLQDLSRITTEDLTTAAQQWLTGVWSIVVVGDAKTLEPQLSQALPDYTLSVVDR